MRFTHNKADLFQCNVAQLKLINFNELRVPTYTSIQKKKRTSSEHNFG
jgi:hypothetical protein